MIALKIKLKFSIVLIFLGKIYRHPWYLLFRQPLPVGSRGIKKVNGPYGVNVPGYYFPGKPNAYFKIPNRGRLHFKSFTIFALIKQKKLSDGPIVEFRGYKHRSFGTHFWIWGHQLFVNIVHNNGKSYMVHFPRLLGMLSRDTWAFVGVSYNHRNGHLVMWVNGKSYFRQAPHFIPDTVGPVYTGIRPSKPSFHPFKGYLSAVSILPYAIPKDKVATFRRFFIKLIGKSYLYNVHNWHNLSIIFNIL
jgi:hypothetical protein